MKRFSRIQTKLILAFLVVVLLPLHGTALYGNWVTSRVLEEVALNSTRHQLELLASNISSDLAGLGHEALYLSRLDSLANLLAGRSRANEAAVLETRNRLTQDFLVYAQNHPFIYQVRYLDEAGQEVVRIDCEAGPCRPRVAEQLQNKFGRYYFTETMQLSAGQLYVSPLDLNQEFGQIEQPHRPVIRLATPLFFRDDPANTSHRRAGIVIINILAEPILTRIEQANAAAQQMALADAGGYYLAHPDARRRWGGPDNLNTGEGLQRDYGPPAGRFFQADSGEFYYPEQAGWQQLAAQLLPPAPFIARQRAILFQRISPFGPTGPAWLLISNQPRAALGASLNSFRWTALTILSLTTLAAMGMVVLLARRLTNPITTLIHGARRIEAGEWGHRIKIDSQDEVGDLAVAFNAMATTQQRNLEQLSALHQAGRHIASRLEQHDVLQATFLAVQKMFPVAYSHLVLTAGNFDQPLAQAEWGSQTWATHRQAIEHQSVLRNCLSDFEWRTGALPDAAGPAGYFCCAPLYGGKEFVGLLEIYGPNPMLAAQPTGNMLAALAAQVSIALENAWLYRQLKEHRAQLQDLVEQLISAQEEERRGLAYDIHDSLIQRLVGARLHLTNYTAELHTIEIDSLSKGLAQLGAAISEARAIIEGLRPAMLDDLGLVEALRQHIQLIAGQTQWQVSFQAGPETMQIPDWIEITAFRIAQEALNNVIKHADTQQVAVTLAVENDLLHLTVRDWGRGFDPQTAPSQRQVGLTSMRERARLVGGTVTIESEPGQGTVVSAILPLRSPLTLEPARLPLKEGLT